MSFYSVGLSALNAAQLGLTTTGQNISNANTVGYHRETAIQATNVSVQTGSGFVGQGVNVSTITRMYSQFLDTQVQQAQAQSSSLNAYQTQISQIDNLLADPSAGLSPSLQGFFTAVSNVASNPQLVSARQSMLSAGNSLAASFQNLGQQFTDIRNGLNTQITQSVNSINSYAQQLSSINSQIVSLSGTPTQLPNDLLDARDNIISQLNQLVKTTVLPQGNGAYNVFIGNGQPLVVGQQTFNLSAVPSPEDPSNVAVGYQSGSTTTVLPNGSLSGGSLGGLLDFRTNTLDTAQNALGQVATVLAQTFNAQHALGQDLNGALGQAFFAQPQPNVVASQNNTGTGVLTGTIGNAASLTTSDYRIQVTGANTYQITDSATNTTSTVNSYAALQSAIPGVTLSLAGAPAVGDVFVVQPTRMGAQNIAVSSTMTASSIAAASPVVVNSASSNTGTAQVTNSGITSTPLPTLPIALTYNSATNKFSYGAGPTLVTYSPGVAMTIAGNVQVTMTGTPANGDVFNIQPNSGGVSDNRNALLLAKLQTANTVAGGTASYQGAYSQLVSQVGSKAAEIQSTAQAQTSVLAQAQSAQQSLSGVNLDEEAANLMRYQQAYQAAGKMMQIASTLFNTLLQL